MESSTTSLDSNSATTATTAIDVSTALEKLRKRKGIGARGMAGSAKGQTNSKNAGGSNDSSSSLPEENEPLGKAKKAVKERRTWDAFGGLAEDKKLDFTDDQQSNSKSGGKESMEDLSYSDVSALMGDGQGARSKDGLYDALEMEDPYALSGVNTADKKSSSLLSYLWSWTEAKVLTNSDLDPLLAKIREQLIQKNVATDIAGAIAESVGASLVGHSHGPLSSLDARLRQSLEDVLSRILTPKTSVDLLRDILASKQTTKEKRPYTIAFIGVNGVGEFHTMPEVFYYDKLTLQKREIYKSLKGLLLAFAE